MALLYLHMEQHKVVIITAPSGAGKTTIVKHLLQQYSDVLSFSISAATRSARHTEQHGVDYYFMTEQTFTQKINNNEFVEWEMVYEGKYYGTLKAELERIWAMGKTPVLDIDVKGAIHVQQQYKNNSLSIFIQPPSVDALTQRLQSRGTETEASLKARVDKASYELTFKNHFDTIIVNDILENAFAKAATVVLDFVKLKA